MDDRGLVGAKDFFNKDVIFSKAHTTSCTCDTCLLSDKLFDELSCLLDDTTSEKIISTESKKICDLLDSELLDTLNCGTGVEFEHLLKKYQEKWTEELEGSSVGTIDCAHTDVCDCIVCSAKREITSKLDEICLSKSIDDPDFLEIIEQHSLIQPAEEEKKTNVSSCDETSKGSANDDVKSYLVCEPNQPMILSIKNGSVDSLLNANTLEPIECAGDADNINLEKIDINELVDVCLCREGQISPYCLQHSVNYCQHMQTKLYDEGCTCTREVECLFCQRLKCNFCSHERAPPSICPCMGDPETDELTLKVSNWLDDKLLEAGVSPELIRQFSEPMDSLKREDRPNAGTNDKEDSADLMDLFAKHIDRKVLKKQVWDCQPPSSDIIITDKMKDEILDINQLFDVRPFPRCYRLEGLKNKEGHYVDIEENYMDLGFNTWKIPTQFPEDTIPLAGQALDIEARLEKEEDIRKKVRNLRSTSNQKKVKIVGLSDDWRPIIETTSDTDYSESYSTEDKRAWAQKTYEEIMDKCDSSWDRPEVNGMWSKVQPILDKYCEEDVSQSWDQKDRIPSVDLENILDKGAELTEKLKKAFPGSDWIGYKEEFWNGLEEWRPPKEENEVRKRLVGEVRKFYNELDSYRNDYERALTNRSAITVNPEDAVKKLLDNLPPPLRSRIENLRSEIPEEWLKDPESVLNNLDGSSVKLKASSGELLEATDQPGTDKVRAVRLISECDSSQLSDEDEAGNIGKEETFYYDDEEQADEEMMQGDVSGETTSLEFSKSNDASNETDSTQVKNIIDDPSSPGFKNTMSTNFTPRPAPYVLKLKEKMMKNSPEGLHPVQQVWFDRPIFPFWTPSVIYDLSEIEKLFFEGVAEYAPEIDETKLADLYKEYGMADRSPPTDREVDDIAETVDQVILAEDAISQPVSDLTSKKSLKDKKDGKKKSKRSATKSISDEDCLIKEDDFKAAIEKLLKEQAIKEETIMEEDTSSGALSLDQIRKGIAGRVKSVKKGAIELYSDKDIDLESIVPYPALKYHFELDIFQKQAVIALEAGLSVFVAAHTSAGKTVAAEYAIAMAMRNGCRVVYTSPIKALSNQKYNDFTKKFKGQMKVGIITGDVQLNKEAECLIMTTEILRSMLYNQSSILSDLEYVIFDEVHYFNDPERGNVWEEVLILLPHQCQLVMLSATVPDVMNFASWVGSLRKREVVVTTTTERPVPLKHYIHFSTVPKYVSVVLPVRVGEGPFLTDNFEKAVQMKKFLVNKRHKKYDMRAEQATNWTKFILHHLKKHQRLPAVIFCFSRKRCDQLATDILSRKVDLVEDEKKKHHIANFFNRQINLLQEEDRNIQQIVTMKELLQQGIGVHHSGILPILKEIVEVLFSESQIKLLFATETFAMGVNMPAKTVVFQQVEKFDGIENRSLKPGEYTQMAGRAGRRGIDKSGTVIITEWNRRMDRCVKKEDLECMLTGSVDPLQSQFRLRYSMILTALKPEGENSIQSIIQKSFFDFSLKAQRSKTLELTEKVYDELKRVAESMKVIPANIRDILCSYCNITYQMFSQHDNIRERMFEHKKFKDFLNVGRLVTLAHERYINVFGVILNIDQVKRTYDIAVLKSSQCAIESIRKKYLDATDADVENWYRLVGFRKMELLPMSVVGMREQMQETLDLVQCKAAGILRIIKTPVFKINKGAANSLLETLKAPRRMNNQLVDVLISFFFESIQNIHSLDFLDEDDIQFFNPAMRIEVMNYGKLRRAFDENLCYYSLHSTSHYPLLDYLETCYWFSEKQRVVDKRKFQAQKEELKTLDNDFDSKLEFLKRNKYIKEDDDVVDTKGRIASRMTNFEVFVTEILLKNILEDLDGPETAALLSCLFIPGVSTEITDSSNEENPLFKPIVAEDEELNLDSLSLHLSKQSREELKKLANEQKKKAIKSRSSAQETNKLNSLIRDYLDLPSALINAMKVVNDIRLNLIEQEKELDIEPMEGSDLSKVSFYLVPIVYAWAKGKPMREIMSVLGPNIQEGILVRWIIKLHETIKDIDSATHHFLKDSRIKEKFETASNSIKRGIIDTPSLYLNQRAHSA